MHETFAPLSSSGFRRLWLSYTTNEFGNWLGEIALAVLVFDRTGSPLAAAALFLGMQFVPALLAPAVVARIETLRPRRLLPALYAAEGVAFLALAALSSNFVLGVVIALVAAAGTLAIAAKTFTRTAVVALLSPTDEVRQGNALINFGFTAAGAAGPAVAGIVVAGLGAGTALALDAASFLFVAALLAATASLPELTGESTSWVERLREGLAYVKRRKVLLRLLIAHGATVVFLTAVLPIEIVFIKETLGESSSGYGFFLAAWGGGMIAGSLVFAALRKAPLQALLLGGVLASLLSYVGLALAGSLVGACVIAAVGGAGNGVFWVAMISLVQKLTADDYQARVVGLLESITAAAPGLGFALGGVITQVASPRASFLVAGIGGVTVVLTAAGSLWKASWAEDRPSASEAQAQVPRVGAADPSTAP